MELMHAEHFFATARERYRILLRRRRGDPISDLTDDPVFKQWRFCNVHREDDKTTVWFRDNVRTPIRLQPPVRIVLATLAFRWFNRIETGHLIKNLLIEGWNTEEARRLLTGKKPLVTGAYMIKTVSDVDKLTGILWSIDQAIPKLPEMVAKWGESLEEATKDLTTLDHIGPFMAYEIVSDLRWTKVLDRARDINTWANMGPGAAHGIGIVEGGWENRSRYNRHSKMDHDRMLEIARQLLTMSRDPEHWPVSESLLGYVPWRQWEMREVEHFLCEYDKWIRANNGEQMKRKFP